MISYSDPDYAPETTRRTMRCWLFGHRFARARKGLTGINRRPVFRCPCGVIWTPLRSKVFRHQLLALGHRDRVARYDLR